MEGFRVRNRLFGLPKRLVLAVVAGVVFGGLTMLFDPLADGGEMIDAIIFTLLMFWVFTLTGVAETQPFVDVGVIGIAYGRRQVIPWENVDRIEWKKSWLLSKRALVVRTRGWKPRGLSKLSWSWHKPLVGLSAFDARVKPSDWLDAVRRFAPEGVAESLPADVPVA